MTAPGFDVDPDQLRAHASTLADYADRLSAIGTGLADSYQRTDGDNATNLTDAGEGLR
jgi:hypothetical protein